MQAKVSYDHSLVTNYMVGDSSLFTVIDKNITKPTFLVFVTYFSLAYMLFQNIYYLIF